MPWWKFSKTMMMNRSVSRTARNRNTSYTIVVGKEGNKEEKAEEVRRV